MSIKPKTDYQTCICHPNIMTARKWTLPIYLLNALWLFSISSIHAQTAVEKLHESEQEDALQYVTDSFTQFTESGFAYLGGKTLAGIDTGNRFILATSIPTGFGPTLFLDSAGRFYLGLSDAFGIELRPDTNDLAPGAEFKLKSINDLVSGIRFSVYFIFP